jgi:stalled ribosome rescue protein Dom34
VNRKFTLAKSEWDSVALERVDTACDPTQVWNNKWAIKQCNTLTLEIFHLHVTCLFCSMQMLLQWWCKKD